MYANLQGLKNNGISRLMEIYEEPVENSITCLGKWAFLGNSEKVELMGFSKLYDDFNTIQNQRYIIDAKNFDKDILDDKRYVVDKNKGTSNSSQIDYRKSNGFRLFKIGEDTVIIRVDGELILSDVIDFNETIMYIKGGKLLKRSDKLLKGVHRITKIRKLKGGNPGNKNFDLNGEFYLAAHRYLKRRRGSYDELKLSQVISED
jgi:hypothetical protein